MESCTTYKRRNAVTTRASILSAARQRFLRESYDSVGLRDIAGAAGVDVALVSRYFGSKEGLFREVVLHEKKTDVFREPQSKEELPGFLARLVVNDADDELQLRMEQFIIMLRSASSPTASGIIREFMHRDVLEPLTQLIGGNDGDIRAHMLLSTLMGVGVLRAIMKIDTLGDNDEDRAECEDRFRCFFDAALTC